VYGISVCLTITMVADVMYSYWHGAMVAEAAAAPSQLATRTQLLMIVFCH
jgi:hypothetical protein